jgi:hypothetical protein
MDLKNYTTPKPGFLLHVWGGFWNDGLGERLLGTNSPYFWFDTKEERAEAKAYIGGLAAQQKDAQKMVVYAEDEGPEILYRTVAKMELEIPGGKRYPYTWDFGYGFSDATAEFMFEEGNYSCDCNKSLFLSREYPNENIELHGCGDTILIHNFTIHHEP